MTKSMFTSEYMAPPVDAGGSEVVVIVFTVVEVGGSEEAIFVVVDIGRAKTHKQFNGEFYRLFLE